jgi:hypothetical protein
LKNLKGSKEQEKTFNAKYEIFAVFKTVVYTDTDFNSEEEFNYFIDKVQNYNTGIMPK